MSAASGVSDLIHGGGALTLARASAGFRFAAPDVSEGAEGEDEPASAALVRE